MNDSSHILRGEHDAIVLQLKQRAREYAEVIALLLRQVEELKLVIEEMKNGGKLPRTATMACASNDQMHSTANKTPLISLMSKFACDQCEECVRTL